jgi:hypothetical protein
MYEITAAGQTISYVTLANAKKAARKIARDAQVEVEVTDTEINSVAYVTSPRAIRKEETGEWFVPWTRLENPRFSAPTIEGYYPAYTRARITATVYRAYDEAADLKWLVHDGRTGGRRLVRTTKEARLLTTEMRHGLTL